MATRTLPAPSRDRLICAWCHDQLPDMPELFVFSTIEALLDHIDAHT